MTTAIFVIFCVVYLGLILGGLPFPQLDRTGVALLGAIALPVTLVTLAICAGFLWWQAPAVA